MKLPINNSNDFFQFAKNLLSEIKNPTTKKSPLKTYNTLASAIAKSIPNENFNINSLLDFLESNEKNEKEQTYFQISINEYQIICKNILMLYIQKLSSFDLINVKKIFNSLIENRVNVEKYMMIDAFLNGSNSENIIYDIENYELNFKEKNVIFYNISQSAFESALQTVDTKKEFNNQYKNAIEFSFFSEYLRDAHDSILIQVFNEYVKNNNIDLKKIYMDKLESFYFETRIDYIIKSSFKYISNMVQESINEGNFYPCDQDTGDEGENLYTLVNLHFDSTDEIHDEQEEYYIKDKVFEKLDEKFPQANMMYPW